MNKLEIMDIENRGLFSIFADEFPGREINLLFLDYNPIFFDEDAEWQ